MPEIEALVLDGVRKQIASSKAEPAMEELKRSSWHTPRSQGLPVFERSVPIAEAGRHAVLIARINLCEETGLERT